MYLSPNFQLWIPKNLHRFYGINMDQLMRTPPVPQNGRSPPTSCTDMREDPGTRTTSLSGCTTGLFSIKTSWNYCTIFGGTDIHSPNILGIFRVPRVPGFWPTTWHSIFCIGLCRILGHGSPGEVAELDADGNGCWALVWARWHPWMAGWWSRNNRIEENWLIGSLFRKPIFEMISRNDSHGFQWIETTHQKKKACRWNLKDRNPLQSFFWVLGKPSNENHCHKPCWKIPNCPRATTLFVVHVKGPMMGGFINS